MADVQPNALPTQSTASATDILVVQNGSTATVAQMPVSGVFYSGSVVPNTLMSSAGSTWAWRSYTPTTTGVTLGNGTMNFKYQQIGKTVHVRVTFIWGSTTSISPAPTFSFPVTPLNEYVFEQSLGTADFIDTLTNIYAGRVTWLTNVFTFRYLTPSGGSVITPSGAQWTSTAPFAYGSGDYVTANFTYEAA